MAHTIFWEMGPEKRQQMNIGDGMLRLSVGLEDSQNLIADLQQAFESVA
nr:PLP-dependent transferase [Aliamphritea spongicola]